MRLEDLRAVLRLVVRFFAVFLREVLRFAVLLRAVVRLRLVFLAVFLREVLRVLRLRAGDLREVLRFDAVFRFRAAIVVLFSCGTADQLNN